MYGSDKEQIKQNASIVLDIGKTNVKLSLLDAQANTLAEQRCPNNIVQDGIYPHHDTDRIWSRMLHVFSEFSRIAKVSAIIPVTHGATAALVNDKGLVLPILDYESELPEQDNNQYQPLRPPYKQSYSPDLPAGLNLGRQLAWLQNSYPAEFAKASHILMYPQYWAWRLSGVAATEVSSLGCHTDLWNTHLQKYSSLVEKKGWGSLFPPMKKAWSRLATIRPTLAMETGLPADCQIVCGIHDSNASLLRHLQHAGKAKNRTVLSTGTWTIAAVLGADQERLDEHADMLANTNVLGEAVSCMRFMGGREFATLAGQKPVTCAPYDINKLIAQNTFALPCFAESGGPFSGQLARISGQAPENMQERYALATLYCVLMTDYCLEKLGSEGDIIIEGSFTNNPYLAALLASLRPQQNIMLSNDTSGTTYGAWMLHHWEQLPDLNEQVNPVSKLTLPGLLAYKAKWRELVMSR
ncbi:FGGY-family carbohydrate kinase [Undibacterium sp. Ji83W]|uniref:FGGY-family carbohydrate kinase n=1 Tax=Undibacterium sp. Ji83W TaxID=3413043 RepID=UPI003BEF4FA2